MADADLARVEGLAPDHALGRDLDVRVRRHDGRVLAAELEGDGRQGLGGLFGDDAGDVGAAGVEDLVPLLVEEGGGFGDGALHGGVAARVQGLGEDLLHHRRTGGAALARLDDDGVAGGDGAGEGGDGELEGEVVGAGTELDLPLIYEYRFQ